jgi:hypothetical protein
MSGDAIAAPSVDALLDDPAMVAELPPLSAAKLLAFANRELARLSTLRDVLRAHLSRDQRAIVVPVVDMPEAARLLGRSVRWLHNHLDELPPRRSLLGTPVWLRRDLEQWLQSRPEYGT